MSTDTDKTDTAKDAGRNEDARTRALDAAEALFYARGVQAVGMDEVRASSGVSLKRLYQLFPTKEQLVVEYLARRDTRWRASLAGYVAAHGATPREQVAAVFDWLHRWFGEPDFRGCAWVNAFGEFGTAGPAILAEVRRHKAAFADYLTGLVAATGPDPAALSGQLLLLAEGAMTTAAISGTPEPALHAKRAALTLFDVGTSTSTSTRIGPA